jgi:hypothetical protein
MTTIEDLAREYAVEIKKASNQSEKAAEVIGRINGLVYENSNNTPISEKDKIEIVLHIHINLLNVTSIIKSTDNSSYLQLVSYMMQQIRGGSK